jgi:amino acid adenylation domain-containing protein
MAYAADALPHAPAGAPVPLSGGQRGLWFLDLLIPERSALHVLEAHRLRGPLDVGALRRALAGLVRRHEMLRTRVEVRDGVPHLRTDPTGDLDWSEADVAEDGLGAAIRRRWEAPFDLGSGRLLRATLLRLGPGDHVLCLVMHQLVSDVRSTEVLFEELSRAYAGDAEPPAPPVRYADFAWWERSRRFDDQLAFWRERLAGLPATAELPLDRPRPARLDHRAGTVRFALDPALVARAAEVSRANGSTLFGTLLTGFVAVLLRYARSGDVAVGMPVADRGRPELDRVVGFLTTMVVLRIRCAGDPTFAELLTAVRETTLAARAHRELPFERLVEALEPERDPGRHPLVQVTFQSCPAPGESLRLSGLECEPVPVDAPASPFDLSMVVRQARDGGLTGSVVYRTALFDRATVERLAGHYRRALAAGLAEPALRLSQLPLLAPAERHAVLEAANATGHPPALTVDALVAGAAAAAPGKVAVSSGAEQLTYAELDVAANRLAHRLRGQGIGRGRRVAVLLERGVPLVVALLGVVRTGAAYVPIDLDQPAERVRLLLDDSGAATTLTQRSLAGSLPGDAPRILLDDLPSERPGPAHRPSGHPGPADPIYLMYTSGSTGRPKGVVVPHRAVTRLVLGLDALGIGADDTFLLLASAAFDASTLEIWTPLGRGGRLAVYPPGRFDPLALGDVLRREGVTVLWLTAALANLIAATVPRVLQPLRLLITGGEALSPEHLRRIGEANPGLVVANGYGPTETTTFATVHPVPRLAHAGTSVPIGRPIGGTRVYVLDPRLEPVPAGVAGELYIGGEGLAHGYDNAPARTAERFVADPFGLPGGRLYRTGDLARWTGDGVLDFLGRVDDQIKMRGFRIEPGEIASVLERHPAVRAAYVMATGDGLAAMLVAHVVSAADPAELAAHLRELLPPFMVPSAWMRHDTLPLSATGKVDRGELRRRHAATARETSAGRPPSTDLERRVAEVYAAVLGRPDIRAGDDFFALGGNSLAAARLAVLLGDRFAVDLPLVEVFRRPALADLAAEISRRAAETPVAEPAGDPVPLSPAQRALWTLE